MNSNLRSVDELVPVLLETEDEDVGDGHHSALKENEEK